MLHLYWCGKSVRDYFCLSGCVSMALFEFLTFDNFFHTEARNRKTMTVLLENKTDSRKNMSMMMKNNDIAVSSSSSFNHERIRPPDRSTRLNAYHSIRIGKHIGSDRARGDITAHSRWECRTPWRRVLPTRHLHTATPILKRIADLGDGVGEQLRW